MTAFMGVPQSLNITTMSGRSKSFSTLDDYLGALINKNVVSDLDDLITNHSQVIQDIQRHWIKGPQTGCLFASKLAKSEEDSWIDIVVTGLPGHDDAYLMIDSAVDQAFSNNAEGIQVIMPDLSNSDLLVNFLRRISVRPNWKINQISEDNASIVPVGLRWKFPDSSYVSWVLGFAPLDSMPITRRAPFASIIMRLGGPGRCPKVVGYDKRSIDENIGLPSVHLADLNDGLKTEDQVCKYWAGTQKQKKEILAGRLEEGARARVTFSLDKRYQSAVDEMETT